MQIQHNADDRFNELVQRLLKSMGDSDSTLSREQIASNRDLAAKIKAVFPELDIEQPDLDSLEQADIDRLRELILLSSSRDLLSTSNFGELGIPRSATRSPASSRVGQEVGRYRLTSVVGRGGFGEVYLAFDEDLGRNVAIKITHRDFNDASVRFACLQEARNVASLDHPNIVPIYDVGQTAEGNVFVVSKYIDGGNLAEQIRSGAMPRLAGVGVVAAIANALHHAHTTGLVHRDVKPANILLDRHGIAFLGDFGIAIKESPTGNGCEIAGTIGYMSPEQARGDQMSPDGRCDIYSLGVVFYELLLGRKPFEVSDFINYRKLVSSNEVRPLRQINDSIEPELERIAMKALALRQSDRYLTAIDFARDLETFVASQGKTSHRDSTKVMPIDVRDSDVFINCTQIDDRPMPGEKCGWVTSFQDNLGFRIEQLVGRPVRISSCPMPAGESNLNETIIDCVPSSKTVVSVVSPSFVNSSSCIRVLEKFCGIGEQTSRRSRLVKVVKTPVPDSMELPKLEAIFSESQELKFFEQDPDTGRAREFDERLGGDSRLFFYERVFDVADVVCRVLRDQCLDNQSELSRDDVRRVVYLAITTSDLAAQREVLRRELEARGCRVVPECPLPLSENEFRFEVSKLLDLAELSIHPIGGLYGMIPEGANESIQELQYTIALNAECEQMLWIPSDLVVRDPRQDVWLSRLTNDPHQKDKVEIIGDRLGAMKAAVIDRLDQTKNKSSVGTDAGPPRVYLICDIMDEDDTTDLESYLFRQGIEVSLPAFEADEFQKNEIHLQNLRECDAAIVYYGKTGRHWVDSNVRDLLKAAGYRDAKPIESRAVFIAAPIDRRKERFQSLSVEVIRQSEEKSFSVLDDFVKSVQRPSNGRK